MREHLQSGFVFYFSKFYASIIVFSFCLVHKISSNSIQYVYGLLVTHYFPLNGIPGTSQAVLTAVLHNAHCTVLILELCCYSVLHRCLISVISPFPPSSSL